MTNGIVGERLSYVQALVFLGCGSRWAEGSRRPKFCSRLWHCLSSVSFPAWLIFCNGCRSGSMRECFYWLYTQVVMQKQPPVFVWSTTTFSSSDTSHFAVSFLSNRICCYGWKGCYPRCDVDFNSLRFDQRIETTEQAEKSPVVCDQILLFYSCLGLKTSHHRNAFQDLTRRWFLASFKTVDWQTRHRSTWIWISVGNCSDTVLVNTILLSMILED